MRVHYAAHCLLRGTCVTYVAFNQCVQDAETQMDNEFTANEFQVSLELDHRAAGHCQYGTRSRPSLDVAYATAPCSTAGHDDWHDEVCCFEGKSQAWKAVSAPGDVCCQGCAAAICKAFHWC